MKHARLLLVLLTVVLAGFLLISEKKTAPPVKQKLTWEERRALAQARHNLRIAEAQAYLMGPPSPGPDWATRTPPADIRVWCEWLEVSPELRREMHKRQAEWLNFCQTPTDLAVQPDGTVIPRQMSHPITGEPVGADLTLIPGINP
jgi:hypothetical protein